MEAGIPGAPPATGGGNGGATDQAKEQASQMKDQAKEQAGQVKEQASGRVREQVDQRSTQAGQQLGTVASDVRTVGEQLREQGKEQPAKLAEQAAERAERVSGYLENSDADRILGDVEDYARRNPWAVVAGGLALGFVASRFLKASSQERYRASTSAGSLGNGRSTASPAPVTGGATGTRPTEQFDPHR